MTEARLNAHESRLDRVEAIVEANSRQIAANTTAIAALRESQVNLQVSVTELREGRAILTQIVVQQRDLLAEFRRSTNATLDRIESTQSEHARQMSQQGRQIAENSRQIAENSRQIAELRQESLAVQQRTEEFRREQGQQIAELRQESLTVQQQIAQLLLSLERRNGGN